MKPGSNKVVVSLKNLTSKEVILKANTVIGKIEVANAVPPMLAPKPEQEKELEKEKEGIHPLREENLLQDEVDLLMSKLDLTGIKDWSPDEQREIKDLIIEYGSLSALKDLDLGKTDKVKHSIKLTDYTPFKERYKHAFHLINMKR